MTELSIEPVVVLGGRGSGLLAAFTLDRIAARGGRQRMCGLLNDTVAAGSRIDGYEVLGSFADWPSLMPETRFLAPLHKAKLMLERSARIQSLGIPDARWSCVVDPDSVVAPSVQHGYGLMVSAHAFVMPGARLGAHVAIRAGACIGHDSSIDDFAFIGSNAVVAGYVTVGIGTYIAPNSSIRDGLAIGSWAVIGLGAVVVRDVPDYAVVFGNPARIIGRVETTTAGP